MRKQLTVVLGLAVLATPAFASKARLQALGEDIYGSFYVNDNRNIWLNSAQINNHKDLVTFEWGAQPAQDSNATPRGEGGVYKSHNNLVYGIHFGGASNSSNMFRQAAGVTSFEDNNIDLFLGGDAGVKWGANLGYSMSGDDETANDANQKSLRSRLGVIAGDLEAYANINIINKAESGAPGAEAEWEGKLGFQVGAIYNMNDYRLFADLRHFTGEANDEDVKFQQLQVGAGRVTRLNDKANLFTRAQVTYAKAENDGAVGSVFGGAACDAGALGCEEYKTIRVPVVIGLEYDATSWLVLRTSVGQTIWGNEEDKDDKRGLAATTRVNAGATLKFGELSVDGVIGNDNSGTPGDSTADGGGYLRTDSLMTRVSMTYRF